MVERNHRAGRCAGVRECREGEGWMTRDSVVEVVFVVAVLFVIHQIVPRMMRVPLSELRDAENSIREGARFRNRELNLPNTHFSALQASQDDSTVYYG